MSEKPVLFFSKKCPHCQQLWKQLSEKGMLNDYVKICVDGNTSIPSAITSVPTIYIKGRPLITGPAIQMFLNSPGAMPGASRTPPPVSSGGAAGGGMGGGVAVGSGPIQAATTTTGISDYLPMEMSGAWSDSYSFIQQPTSPLEHSFSYISGGSPNITGGGGGGGGVASPGGRTAKSNGLDERYEALMASREKDVRGGPGVLRR